MTTQRITHTGAAAILTFILLALVLVACGDDNPSVTVPADDGSETVTEGALIYADRCARCHGDQGQGGTVDGIDDIDRTKAEVMELISGGAPGMPALGAALTSEEIEALADHALQLNS